MYNQFGENRVLSDPKTWAWQRMASFDPRGDAGGKPWSGAQGPVRSRSAHNRAEGGLHWLGAHTGM